jgi:uncharacterized protein (UPF0548 family)
MLSLRKPTPELIAEFLQRQATLSLTYTAIGATATTPPAGYVVDHTRRQLGRGEYVFESAQAAIRVWRQFQLGWIEAEPHDTPIREGNVIAVLAQTFGVWWLNACRIVYVIDEANDALKRFGFAYGTLPAHAGTGEERFLVEWNRVTDEVYYDILAFSQMRHPLAILGYPLVRRTQKRFGLDSADAVQRAVQSNQVK